MPRNRTSKFLGVGLLVLTLIISFSLHRLNNLNSTPLDPANFSWINKAEIYFLGIVMSAIAYPIYPEVAREHMMMYAPFTEDPKTIRDDFFLGSSVVQDAIKKTRRLNRPYRLAWPASAYKLFFDPSAYKEARIALALNGGYLRVENGKAIVRIKIAYPKNSYAPLIQINGVGTIGVEEGLYWVLQEVGWLHTGYVEWIAPLES
jgi:hypothetical protein